MASDPGSFDKCGLDRCHMALIILLRLFQESDGTIDRKYHRIVFAFFMSLFMSCIMSLVISVYNVGWVSNIISIWLSAWLFAFVVAFPTIFMVSPVVHKLVSLVLKETE